MRVNAFLLGFTIPDSDANTIFAIDPLPAIQTHKFAWSLARALRDVVENLGLLSFCPVQNYPSVPKIIFHSFEFEQCEIKGKALGFINIIGLKHLTRFVALLLQIPRIKKWDKSSVVFIHGVHSPNLLFGLILSKLGHKFIPVLTDPPGLILPTDGFLARFLKTIDKRLVGFFLKEANGVIALSPALVESLPINIERLVFPGILGAEWQQAVTNAASVKRAGNIVVLYAGGLNSAYGVDRLLDAASRLPEVTFVMFGKGDQLARIKALAGTNVLYGGFVDKDELASNILSADILINPRPTDVDFSINSFPSKLLEYAASGRPTLTTRIHGIPDELVHAFNYIDDETAFGISDAIQRLTAVPQHERLKHAAEASELVTKLYSEKAIGTKIRNMLETIYD